MTYIPSEPIQITITQRELTRILCALCSYSANTLVPHEDKLAIELALKLSPFSTDQPQD
jgi:hypothetical protein